MFLDIVCFLVGLNESTLCRVYWNGDDSCSPMLGLQNLKDRSLIKWAKDGGLYMHEQLQDMGQNIAREVTTVNLYRNQIYICKIIRFEQHVLIQSYVKFFIKIPNETMSFKLKKICNIYILKTWHGNEVLCLFILAIICNLLNVIGTSDGKFRRFIFEKT
jgi:hypothetical protein